MYTFFLTVTSPPIVPANDKTAQIEKQCAEVWCVTNDSMVLPSHFRIGHSGILSY